MDATRRRRSTAGIRVDVLESIGSVCVAMLDALEAGRPWLMTFANPATAVVARHLPELRCALRDFDMVAPDGLGMVLAIKLVHGCKSLRVSFDSTSLAPVVFDIAAERGLSVVLVGGVPGVAETARARLEEKHPGIQIIATFDGYGDERTLINKLTALQPTIVVAGMGTMVQERFLLRLVENGWTGLGFTCGGYLDQLALKGTNYYPNWVNHYDLRWAYRLMMEPRRLWRRYLLEYPEFGVKLCRDLIWTRQG
jgi:N-acetylglucosaminyldiphosphoundecaprenol N-acetyl-beta-D-mannosaminyltransferase